MLYTIIAYILLFTLIPVASGIASIAWLPAMIGMNRLGINKYWSAITNGLFTAVLSLGIGWFVFGWLGVTFGWIAGFILMVMAYWLGNHRIKTRQDTIFEIGNMNGDVGGLWVGIWFINFPDDLLWPIIMTVIAFGVFIFAYRQFVLGKHAIFWALVQQHPAAAKAYFFNSHDWTFLNQHNYEGMKETYERLGYQGPFRHAFDGIEAYIYYKGEDINKSQNQFITSLQSTIQAIEKHKI